MAVFTLSKAERLYGRKEIEQLFQSGNSQALTAYPLRLVYSLVESEEGEMPVRMMVSVSKRRLHHAVDRNRAKRQVREAFRKRKPALLEDIGCVLRGNDAQARTLRMAFVWMSDTPRDSAMVEKSIGKLMRKLPEKI